MTHIDHMICILDSGDLIREAKEYPIKDIELHHFKVAREIINRAYYIFFYDTVDGRLKLLKDRLPIL